MAGSFANDAENKILERAVGKSVWAPTAYVALSTTAMATDAGTFTEVPNSNGYARITTAGADWNTAASGSISNANDFTFTASGGAWGTILCVALYDSGTHGAGNMIAWMDLSAGVAIGDGDTLTFEGGTPGGIVITQD